MALNPMHQFEIYKIGPEINLGNINLSFTNASLFMTISAILILSLLFFGTKKKSLIPSKIQLIAELSYTFVYKMISDTGSFLAVYYHPRAGKCSAILWQQRWMEIHSTKLATIEDLFRYQISVMNGDSNIWLKFRYLFYRLSVPYIAG